MLLFEDASIPMGDAHLSASFAVKPQSRVAVLGPSGAGKSTLLNAIAGFLTLSQGAIRWDGARLDDQPAEARPVSILFQDSNLFPHLTVERNLSLALRRDAGRLDAAQRAQVSEALAQVGLEGLGGRKPGALSGGQQSRAALARVLLQQRPILLLDEPFAALGPALKADMLELVGQVAERLGALVLMVTHDAGDARRFAQEVILVADTKAHAPVATKALFDNPPPALRAYLG